VPGTNTVKISVLAIAETAGRTMSVVVLGDRPE
jgi:hypothetical protein